MKAVIDRETCTGCGTFPEVCPEVFALDNEGLAYTLVEVVPPEKEQETRDAADQCPVEAIAVE